MGKELWGKSPEGEEIFTWTLENKNGMRAKFMNFGANLLELWVPDASGHLSDIVLGYRDLESYFDNNPNYGCLVGRHANRIGQAKFTLDGRTFQLDVNDGRNNLHSGFHPLHHRSWETSVDEAAQTITFTIDSPDGDMGFPGSMTLRVTYTLSDDNSLRIDYNGIADQRTVFNPTNHSYFNLSGHDSGTILDEILYLDSDAFTFADSESIPDGTIRSVEGTPMDFRIPKTIGRDIDADYDQLNWAGGYDHNWILKTKRGEITKFGSIADPKSGRVMSFYTDLPGVQVYTGNYINESGIGKGGCTYPKRGGICFETQYYPNALNVPSFPQPVIEANTPVHTATIYKFTTL